MGVLSAKCREPLCAPPFSQVALNRRGRSYVLSSRSVKCSHAALRTALMPRRLLPAPAAHPMSLPPPTSTNALQHSTGHPSCTLVSTPVPIRSRRPHLASTWSPTCQPSTSPEGRGSTHGVLLASRWPAAGCGGPTKGTGAQVASPGRARPRSHSRAPAAASSTVWPAILTTATSVADLLASFGWYWGPCRAPAEHQVWGRGLPGFDGPDVERPRLAPGASAVLPLGSLLRRRSPDDWPSPARGGDIQAWVTRASRAGRCGPTGGTGPPARRARRRSTASAQQPAAPGSRRHARGPRLRPQGRTPSASRPGRGR